MNVEHWLFLHDVFFCVTNTLERMFEGFDTGEQLQKISDYIY